MEFDLKNKQQSGRQFDPAKCTFDDQPTDQLLNGDPNDLCDKMKLSRGELMLVLSWDLRDRLVANFNRHSKLLYSSETVADDLRKKMVEDNNELLQQLINLPSTAGSQCPSTGVQFKLDWSLRNRILVGGMKNHLAIKEPANELLKEKAFSDDLIEENNTLISALHNLAVREHEPAKQQKDQANCSNGDLTSPRTSTPASLPTFRPTAPSLETRPSQPRAVQQFKITIRDYEYFIKSPEALEKRFQFAGMNWNLKLKAARWWGGDLEKCLVVTLECKESEPSLVVAAQLWLINQVTAKEELFSVKQVHFKRSKLSKTLINDYHLKKLTKLGYVQENTLRLKIDLRVDGAH